MTQEDKQLLIKDLCGRLPYGVKINIRSDYTLTMEDMELNAYHLYDIEYNIEYRGLRPYLRPMSSMTEGEILEFIRIGDSILRIGEKKLICILSLKQMDWLNAHHFDYRELIEKGLALEAPEGMHKTK